MRISDWSSDVCSSDLTSSGRAAASSDMNPHYHRPAVAWSANRLRQAPVSQSVAVILPAQAARSAAASASRSPRPASPAAPASPPPRSEEHTSELQSLMRISYAVFCLKKKKIQKHRHTKYE